MRNVTVDRVADVLPETDALVCLLPLTDATRGFVAAPLLEHLKHGAAFINAARGEHVVEDDLLAALDSGAPPPPTLPHGPRSSVLHSSMLRTHQYYAQPHARGKTCVDVRMHAVPLPHGAFQSPSTRSLLPSHGGALAMRALCHMRAVRASRAACNPTSVARACTRCHPYRMHLCVRADLGGLPPPNTAGGRRSACLLEVTGRLSRGGRHVLCMLCVLPVDSSATESRSSCEGPTRCFVRAVR